MKRCMGCMEEYTDEVCLCPYCGYEENTLPDESFHLVPGTVIGKRYTVGRVLGFGGFGVTYIGFDMLLEKKVAIKEYLPSEFATRVPTQTKISVYSEEKTEQFEQGMTRFVEEARQLAKFNDTSEIVNVYDCIMENDTAYIVMEYLEGESLKQHLNQKKKLSIEEAEAIILPILRSLKSIHDVGLIHRDIAPDNIFLTNDGRVKLLDFGAARYASATHSRSLSVIYKPGYAPEEQYQSRGEQGPWTDVYALAATMYKMITGVTPDTSVERRAKDMLKPPSKLGIDIPKNKETALMNALNVQVKNRTQSAGQFLEEWQSQGEVLRILDTVKQFDVGKLSKKAKVSIIASVVGVGAIVAVVFGSMGVKRITERIEMQKNQTRVPSIVNETIVEAKQRADESGLQLEIVGREYSSEIEKDLILKQETNGGSLLETGSLLSVVVSGGVKKIYMPEVLGKPKQEAITILEEAGFVVSTEEAHSETVPLGNVISASIATKTQCDEGTKVTLYISKGFEETESVVEEPYIVEYFVGMKVIDIEQSLSGKRIYIDSSKREYSDRYAAGIVLSQQPEVGTEMKQGDTLYVVVSLGKKLIRIPDLTLKDVSTAKAMLNDVLAGLELDASAIEISIREEYDSAIQQGLIIEQSLEAEKEVEAGAKLELVVSKGKKPVEPPANKEEVPVHVHDYSWNVTVIRQATCSEEGEKRNTCSCGDVKVEKIAKREHSVVEDEARSATCTEVGMTEGSHCAICQTVIVAQNTIPAKGHTEVSIAGKAATCTAAGLTDGKKCSVCGMTTVAQNTIPAKGHTETRIAGKAATCTATGLTDGKKCSVCGTVVVAQNTIPAKGHTETKVAGRTPTCTATGLTEGRMCSTCGAVIVAQNSIPAVGHVYSGGVYDAYCDNCNERRAIPNKTQYGYYHYTNGTRGQYSVCGYSGNAIYHWTPSSIYCEYIWVDAPLKLVSASSTSYNHTYYSDKCPKYNCTHESWVGGAYVDANGVYWYREMTRTVPGDTPEVK